MSFIFIEYSMERLNRENMIQYDRRGLKEEEQRPTGLFTIFIIIVIIMLILLLL